MRSFAEGGTRVQRGFEVVETPPSRLCTRRHHDESTSRSVWCSPVGAPADGNEASTRCQKPTTLSLNPSGKNASNPLLGGVCLLTTGDLIRVGRGSWERCC